MPRTVSIIPKNNESLKVNSIQKLQNSSKQYVGTEGYLNQPEIGQETTFPLNSFDNENFNKKTNYHNDFNSKNANATDALLTNEAYLCSPA